MDAGRPPRLALIEVVERDGRPQRWVDVQAWPVEIGRALDNDLVLDDPHLAAHHARLQAGEDGEIVLQVLDTRNGATVDGQRLGAGDRQALPPRGAQIQLGTVRLRLRLPGEQLAAERPLPAGPGRRRGLLPATALALMALVLAEQWAVLDPGADATAWLPTLAGMPIALVAWSGLWALMSKLFQHRFDFGGHLRIVLPWLLAIELLDLLLPQLAAALGWAALWHLSQPLQAALGVALVRAHLAHLLPPQHGRAVTAGVLTVALAGGAIALALNERRHDRFTRAPYMSTLPLPALNATTASAPDTLVQELGPLAEKVAARVRRSREDEAADGLDAD